MGRRVQRNGVQRYQREGQGEREHARKDVLEAIEALNYRPNASAQRKLQSRGPKSIGLVIKEIHNPYFADVIVGAQQKAREEGRVRDCPV